MKRQVKSLSSALEPRLGLYALAASAAGMGVLVLTQPALAKIIYTPAKMQLTNQDQVFFDLNHDGVNDFFFYGASISRRSISTFFFRLTESPAQGENAIWGVESHKHASCAAPLKAGVQVGAQRPFQTNRVVLFDASGGPNGGTAYCPWGGQPKTAYLGLKFAIQGKTHYGWARAKVVSMYPYNVLLTGYAYETVPNKAILTGKSKNTDVIAVQPATLGQLARGASAMPVGRVNQTAVPTH